MVMLSICIRGVPDSILDHGGDCSLSGFTYFFLSLQILYLEVHDDPLLLDHYMPTIMIIFRSRRKLETTTHIPQKRVAKQRLSETLFVGIASLHVLMCISDF